MIAYLSALILVGMALVGILLEKAYFYVPLKELRRRATRGDDIAAALADVAVFDGVLRVTLITLTVITAAGGVVLFARSAPYILGFIVVVVLLALGVFWQPRVRLAASEARLAQWCAPAFIWLMPRLQPVIAPVIVILQRFYKPRKHTGLFEKDDMTDLFERQRYQRDNRIAEADIERLQKLLRVSELTVGSIMIPRKRVVAVNEKESINPVLVNELHQTGHSYFPVYEGESQNIIGTLAIQAIADIHQHGVIRDNIDRHVAFLYHNDNIEQALHAFYTTNQHLFIVLNDSGKYIGILTINDALRQFVGTLKHHVFDAYEDREKVVARHTTTKTVSQKSTEVVE